MVNLGIRFPTAQECSTGPEVCEVRNTQPVARDPACSAVVITGLWERKHPEQLLATRADLEWRDEGLLPMIAT